MYFFYIGSVQISFSKIKRTREEEEEEEEEVKKY